MRLKIAAIGLLLSLLVSSQAIAQQLAPATAAVEREARAMLKPCKERDPERQDLCFGNQQDFIRNYVWARAGSPGGAVSLVSDLAGPNPRLSESPDDYLGIPTSRAEACAWRGATNFHERPVFIGGLFPCDGFTDLDKARPVVLRAYAIHELLQKTIPMPPENYHPLAAGQTKDLIPAFDGKIYMLDIDPK